VLHDPGLVEPLPAKIGQVLVEYLGTKSLEKKFRQVGTAFPAIEIGPIRTQRDMLVVNCSDYQVTVRRGKVMLHIRGGNLIYWRLDASAGEFVRARVEPWSFHM
jgi:hypothetical protein